MELGHSLRVECGDGDLPSAESIGIVAWDPRVKIEIAGELADPQGRRWRSLRLTRADRPECRLEIAPVSQRPLVLQISSNEPKSASDVAFFIAMEGHGRILGGKAGHG